MADNKNTLSLKILDTDFTVKAETDKQKEKLKKIEAYVNDELTKIKGHHQFVNHIRIAILGCMNITEELFDLQAKVDQIEAERAKESSRFEGLEDQVTSLQKTIDDQKKDYEDQIAAQSAKLAEMQENQSLLERQLNEKNELLNQYREKLTQSKNENDANRKSIIDLQNQLFENQIELVKLSKEAKMAPQDEQIIDNSNVVDEMEDAELSDIIRALKEQQARKDAE